MTKEQLMKLGLSEEQATKIIEGFGTMIPKSRFDEVNNAKKQLEKDVADRDGQLEELKESASANDELKAQIEKLQSENTSAKETYEAEVNQLKLDGAVERALIGAKAKNIKAVKALLDLENAEFDGDDIKGLADQLKSLQEGEDSKFLFEVAPTTKQQQFKGFKPGEAGERGGQETTPTSLADAVQSHFSQNQ
ncbi:phage scaffolding protein [Lysinibacillus xylanilyticus]|uniref:phage scaffolding protein n=1 Tax=Lysinibacillus xylanilyticus TaxID=582475 RepID=UPI003D04026D